MKRLLISLALLILFGAGCAHPTAATPSTAPPSSAAAGTVPPSSAAPGGETGGTYQVRYGWAVPSTRIEVAHHAPVPPLRQLVEIHTGDHAQASPGYARISFYFRGTFPGYNFNYAREVLTEGRGDPISLEGNGFLRIQFVDAQGAVRSAADRHIGLRNLRSYGPAGDFEGHLSYGLGIQSAPGSDQVLAIRVGELTKPDGNGGLFYVVAFDVQAG